MFRRVFHVISQNGVILSSERLRPVNPRKAVVMKPVRIDEVALFQFRAENFQFEGGFRHLRAAVVR